MTTLLKEMLRRLWPQPQPQNSKSEATEKVFTDKKLLKSILRYMSRTDLKTFRLVNYLWREVASEIIRSRGNNCLNIFHSRRMEMFVQDWNEKGVNLLHQEYKVIFLRHDYHRETLDSFWKTIAPVVTMLEIIYSDPTSNQNILSPIPFVQVVYPRLNNLRISLYNINQGYALDTCKNIFREILLNSFASSISLRIIGEERHIEISDILTNSLKNWKNVDKLKAIHLNNLQMRSYHYDILSTIVDLKLAHVSLNIPKFEDLDETGEALIRFLKSQESSLNSLNIEDLSGVFDSEFPRLKHLTSLKIGNYQQSPTAENSTGIGLDYHEKLPALKCLNLVIMSDKRPIHFLPREDTPAVTSVETIRIENENILDSRHISILKSFRNLRNVTIPGSYGYLRALYQIHPNIRQLGFYSFSHWCVGIMLTGLKFSEITMLETIGENILDKLALDLEYCNNTNEARDRRFLISCLKRLEGISFEPRNGFIYPIVPSFAVFKILLLNIDSLGFVGIGNGMRVLMKDLPRDRPVRRTDFCLDVQKEWQYWSKKSLLGTDIMKWTLLEKIFILIMILCLIILLVFFF